MEDKKKNLPLWQQNSFKETPVDIFGDESSKEPEIFKDLSPHGVRNYVWQWFTSETVRTMYRKVKNIKKFRSLLLASLSSRELRIAGS